MADRICDNCMSRVPQEAENCPKCGIHFENTNPGGALPNGWVLNSRYTVGRYIDIDGEGVTYSAIDGNTLQRVVLKEFMPVTLCAARNEDGSIRPKPGCEVLFKTTRMDYSELYAQLLRLGAAEGLVQVLDVVEENNTAYAVMEKIEGPTLAEFLTKRAGPVDAARTLALLRPILAGVDAMHAQNLVHRGISPENIVLESGGTAKLAGYGTLALRQQGSELKPKLYPGYSAPEQYTASEFEGRYTDIYALGALHYRLLTGMVPQPADDRKMQDALKPARALNREIPTFLSSGVARAMRVLPAERIQSIADLRLTLSGEGGRDAKGPLGLTKQQLTVGIIALAAIVVLVVVFLLVALFSGGKDDDSSSLTSSLSSSVASSVPAEMIPSFVDKLYSDILVSAWAETFTFAEPEEAYSPTVPEGRVISQTPAADTPWDGTTPIKLVVSKGPEPVSLPELAGKTEAEAKQMLAELGITAESRTEANNGQYEKDQVVRTDPVAGTLLTPGKDKVVLYVAGEVNTIPMPELTGLAQVAAEDELNRQGIQYQIEMIDNPDGVSKNGLVASTDPPGGYAVATGATIVNVRVYKNYLMPNIDASLYTNRKPSEGLLNYLTARGIPYQLLDVSTTDQSKDGYIDHLEYTANIEVTSETPVLIYVYKYTAPPPPPSSSSDSDSGT